ncbi:hypothetical protein AB0C07_11695 [Actinoplanes missouriensis]|uniref:hypothetical protein n=1 Tax=Actinoplanes missouriensis TaxID=1866 RepID=UPI0033F16103
MPLPPATRHRSISITAVTRKANSTHDSGSVVRAAPTADDFVAELRRLRAQAGDPPLRQLHQIAQKRISEAPGRHRMDPLPPSTTSEILSGKRLPRLPRLEFVESYVAACLSSSGLDEPAITAEVTRWRELWRSLTTPEKPAASAQPMLADRPSRRRVLTLAAVFLAGLGIGIAGTLSWTSRPLPTANAATPETPDTCLSPGTTPPAGQDVLRLPPTGQRTGSWWANKPTIATLTTDGPQFQADIAAGTARPGDVIIVKSDVTLVKGRSYALAFSATADRATTIRVRAQDSQPPAYQESYDREVSVDQTPCTHLYQFVAQKSSTHSELTFQVGGRPHDFRLQVRDITLTETPI